MDMDFIAKLNKQTENCKNHVERWNNKEIEHSNYWSCPTACIEAIAQYGADNIYLVSSSYHGRYEDDDASFTYYNNVTGEFFHDEWSTRFAAPAYGSYECLKLEEAWNNGLVDKEKLYKITLERAINSMKNFKYDPWYTNFEMTCRWGLRVKVSRGRKWKGTGYLVGTFTKSYQWGVKLWRSNNDYGTSTTRYAKIYDPTTNRIESVNASYVEFLDLDNFVEEYKNTYITSLNNTTVDNLCVGRGNSSYSPCSGDHFGTPMYINIEFDKFEAWMDKNHTNNFDLSVAYDVVEEEAKKKFEEFKASKMPGIIDWVRNNTDKETEEDIMALAEHIFNKKYN